MQYNFLIIFILLTINNGFSQDIERLKDTWTKIYINDGYVHCDGVFQCKYRIDKKDLNLVLERKNQNDTIIKSMNISSIDSLFNVLNNDNIKPNDPLSMFNRDSLWLIENAEMLWNNYKPYSRKKVKSVAIDVLRNYHLIKESIEYINGRYDTDDCFVYVQIYGLYDTLEISTESESAYMLPWENKDTLYYNSKISTQIASLLPDNSTENKERLSGLNFNYELIHEIYNYNIEARLNLINAKSLHPIKYRRLEKHYQIVSADFAYLSSIDWADFRFCLDLVLQDTSIADNLYFDAILGKRPFLYPVQPLIKHKKKVLDKLINNPVYQYVLDNETCQGYIKFVNNKSLGEKAKENFLEDAKENNLDVTNIKDKLDNAIFFALKENRNDERSFSRWLFLEDGTYILWQIDGDFLINLPDEVITNQGYVCKVISPDLFK